MRKEATLLFLGSRKIDAETDIQKGGEIKVVYVSASLNLFSKREVKSSSR